MKHGYKSAPYTVKRVGVQHIAVASCEGCPRTEELNMSKNLPYDVIITMFRKKGLHSKYVSRDKSRPFWCEDCLGINKMKSVKEPEMTQPTVPQANNVADLARISVRFSTYTKLSPIYSSNSVMLAAIIPRPTWEKFGKPPMAECWNRSGKLVIQFSMKNGIKHSNPTAHSVGWQFSKTRHPMKLQRAAHFKTPAIFVINPNTLELISEKPYKEIENALNSITGERITPLSVASTIPVSTIQEKSSSTGKYTVEDGAANRELINEWLEWAETNGWQPKLEITENNRLKISVVKIL